MFNDTFKSLSKEAAFAFDILNSGVTQIRKANYAEKGIYYQSFINLSVGIERVSKLCILLDFYIKNNGQFPNDKFLRKIGHDINKLYTMSINIKQEYTFEFQFMDNLDGTIHQNILSILSDFAVKDRYENLNNLVNAKQENNPISIWFHDVDMQLFEKHISENKKLKIIHNAKMMNDFCGHFMLVQHTTEDGDDIDDVEESSLRTGIYEAVSPYRQLYVAQIIRFWTELLRALQYEAMSLGKEDIPWFNEGFGCFYNKDSYLRSRKNYEI